MEDKKKIRSWLLYDVANSAFATVVMAAVMPIYYSSAIGGDEASWAFTQSAAALIIAVISPLLGAIADYSGNKVAFLRVFTALGAAASIALAIPGPGQVQFASVVVIVGMVGFGAGLTFYDALLNDLTTPDRRDAISSRGYAFGYVGGGLLLLVDLLIITFWEQLGLPDKAAASQIAFVTVGVWWVAFSFPLLRRTGLSAGAAAAKTKVSKLVKIGFGRLGRTFTEIRKYPELFKFMIGYWFYFDGINTVIIMAASYGTGIGIGQEELIAALLLTQFIGFPATLLLGRLATRFGSKLLLGCTLLVYLIILILGYFMTNAVHFFALACLVGLVQGGAQAIARAMYSRMIPRGRIAEFTGFLSFSSRLFSFGGPLTFGIVHTLTGSSRSALIAIAGFFLIGMLVLALVNTRKAELQALG